MINLPKNGSKEQDRSARKKEKKSLGEDCGRSGETKDEEKRY